ncbi:MAG: hypothetical protein CMH70_08180 [Nitrosomonadaceae bacterium]|nr:hypothetical protein [Nitrosomonadaceae bacterium]
MHVKKLILLVLLLITGCSFFPSVPSVLYKIDIQQGNVITQEMVDKLKPGMTRSQVRFVLCSALIDDIFHDNRWDYVYRLEQHGNLIDEYKLTVFFENDKLIRTTGDFISPLASVSPKHIDSAKSRINEEKSVELIPNMAPSGVEPESELSSKSPISEKQSEGPVILAIDDDKIPSHGKVVTDDELELPPPPPGISDGIEAD